ncbi:MAG: zinc-dependent metalloprotease [Candidatus Azotimanducaceae bacterium]
MIRRQIFSLVTAFAALILAACADEEVPPTEAKSIAAITAASERIDGFFTLFRKRADGSVHMLIRQEQLDHEFIYTVVAQDGVVQGGHFRGQYRDNKVLVLRRHFDRIEFVETNTGFYFDPASPLSRSGQANIPPAVLAVEKIVAEDKENGELLVALNPVLLKEKLSQIKPSANPKVKPGERFSLGKLSDARSKVVAINNYPENTSLLTEMVYENPAPVVQGDEDVTDSRAISVRVQHTLVAMPDNDFVPRAADYRIGYFTDRVTDLTSRDVAPYRDMITRWHLVKKNPEAAISDPVEPITWWIENTTPYEYRDVIKAAALSWNLAFEEAGFSNAIVVKQQPDDAGWDAGDIRYNVLRWTSSPNPPFGGYGPSFSNPRTGQIIGADIMLEFSFLTNRLRIRDVLQPGGLDVNSPFRHCELGAQMQMDQMFAAQALAAGGLGEAQRAQLIEDSMYMLILHEIGHTLGLTHNMRASQLQPDVFDAAAVAAKGLSGSVMDYEAVNVAPPGKTQTPFYQNRPGLYDLWAIEFGYAPSLVDAAAEKARLQALLARSTEPELAYGNDADDMRRPGRGIDPHINIYDHSGDAVGYAEQRLQLVRDIQADLLAEYQGETYQALYNSFAVLMNQLSRSGGVVSRYVGGVHINRAAPGAAAAPPYQPVAARQQQRAMQVLAKYIFAPDALGGSESVYQHLQRQRRGFDFSAETEDPKLHAMMLSVQKRILDHLLHPRTLQRVSDSRLYGNDYELTQMLNDLTGAIFEADKRGTVNSIRQNLQVEYLKRLVSIWRGNKSSKVPHLARSAVLAQLEKLARQLGGKRRADAATKAHRRHLQFLVDRALSVNV